MFIYLHTANVISHRHNQCSQIPQNADWEKNNIDKFNNVTLLGKLYVSTLK